MATSLWCDLGKADKTFTLVSNVTRSMSARSSIHGDSIAQNKPVHKHLTLTHEPEFVVSIVSMLSCN